jgi:hypothetical protein
MQLHLPNGAPDLTVSLGPAPQTTGSSRDSRHLSIGVLVVDLATHKVVAHNVYHQGVGPQRATLVSDATGPTTLGAPAPSLPFQSSDVAPVAGLPAGDYGVVAFGSDGGRALPNPFWSASITVSGQHDCRTAGSDRIVELDATDGTTGTVAAAGPALYADGGELGAALGGDMVAGMISAFGGLGGEASVAYDHPSGDGEVTNEVAPFASAPGAFTWSVDALGPSTATDIVAVEVSW